MQCQPRPHIISEEEIKTRLARNSLRVTNSRGRFTTSVRNPNFAEHQSTSCLMLHRCHEHAGCCSQPGQKCQAHREEDVVIDVTVTIVQTVSSG